MSLNSLTSRFNRLSGNLKGAVALLFAAGLFSLMTVFIKLLGSNLHVTQILFVRQVVMTAIVLPTILRHFPGSMRTRTPGLQFLRILLAMGAMLMGFTAVIHMPLADATALGFAKSFFVTIFAVYILSEHVGIQRWTAVALGFVGVVIMLRPGTDAFTIYGLMAVGGAACAGLVMVIIRLMSRTESATTILTWQAVGVGVCMAVPAWWHWQSPSLHEWGLLLALGIASYVGQMANILAYKFGEASVLASLDYVRLIYAALFGYIVFETLPSLATWIGASIIVGASLFTILREAKKNRALASDPAARSTIAH